MSATCSYAASARPRAILDSLSVAVSVKDVNLRYVLANRRYESLEPASVTDSCPGIPAGLRERVCEPLFSTKRFGTGLGLPLVQRVMEQHGGAVELGDAAGGGTVVTLRFPPAEVASAT